MTTPSLSFRITRHTEDLAQTIHALSQRMVRLEQRLAGLEAELRQDEPEVPAAQLTSLAHVDQLLRDCRELLSEPGSEEGGDFPSPQAPKEGAPLASEGLDRLRDAA